ncbi:alkaline phosphatase [Vulgatibacter incomptus]|uniref:Alkaline phosphatase n=1 Tax=Vulgatibacter incomptus TaxID=1391653 RepID=A0A0K1PIG4_9BACT|nr:alkaline phosphatase [Vulgatibacter incomptus]AKU93201.1 Alkaline phosphatase [Vulgatibacter incomptus]
MSIKVSVLAALLLAASPAAAAPAKNVIFFLGDGMGPTTVTASRIYGYGEAGKLSMEQLPRTARIKTFSLDAQTTDSAPSMAAYMTGVKMRNEVLSMTSETVSRIEADGHCAPTGNGTPVPTFLEHAKAAGKAVGVVTTTELTHATPAATYSHICNRNLAYDISAQAAPGGAGYNTALGNGVDVLLGGGANHWVAADAANPTGRPDGRNLVGEMQAAGYSYVNNGAGLRGLPASTTKLLGLFSKTSHMSYEIDRDPAAEPSLAEMTVKAIEVLKKASAGTGQGFFLMVEGGRIDHALHDTKAQKALVDTLAFDSAIKAAMDLVDLRDTLIVVTADHDHTMTMNGYGQRGQGTHVLDVVRDPETGAPLVDADGYPYPTLVFGTGPNRPLVRTATDTLNLLDKNFTHISAVRTGAGGETHGGGDVMLMAGGAGAERFKGTLDNTRVFDILMNAAEL